MADSRENISIRLRPATIREIEALAEQERRTRSDMVRVLLLEAMEARKTPKRGR